MGPANIKLFQNKKLPLLFTLIIVIATSAMQLYYVSNTLSGNVNWRVLPSEMFGGGVPDFIKKNTGVTNIYGQNNCGWDGQFHYYISNDPFIERDTHKRIDAPIYRYQRIGLPLTAKFFATVLGHKYVHPHIYHSVSLIFFAAALFMFLSFLQSKGLSLLYALPWALSPGIHLTLLHGLPDALADSYFIIAFLMLLRGRYGIYALFATFAALSRESYVLTAFVFFLMNFFGFFKKEDKYKIKTAAVFAIPGIVLIVSNAYINYKLYTLYPDSTSISVIRQGIMNWPFYEFFKYLHLSIKKFNQREFVFLILFLCSLLLTVSGAIVSRKKEKKFLAFIPLAFLMATFGHIVMFHFSGYMKGSSILLVVIPLMLAYLKDVKIYRVVCFLFLTICTFYGFFEGYYKDRLNFSPIIPVEVNTPTHKVVKKDTGARPLENFAASIKVLSASEKNKFVNMPFWSLFGKDYKIYEFEITNLSNELWYRTISKKLKGKNHVALSYHIFNAKDSSAPPKDGPRIPLPKDIQPGESFRIKTIIREPKDDHTFIRVSLIQEGVAWFYHKDPNSFIDLR